MGGDGQVTLGNIVVKATARKVRRLYQDRILAGFAGATADAFTLFERFEAKLEKHQGNLLRSAVELAKDWRTDRMLRRLEAMLAIADRKSSLIITGTGDVLEPEHGPARHRQRRRLRAGRGAGAPRRLQLEPAEIVEALARDRRRPVHLHQPEPRDRDAVNADPDARPAPRADAAPMMTPQEIVHELDKYIVGQGEAKRAVAIALRNRWRRAQVAEPLRTEITPKNILMIGPTGVGKTEIARRLARLANAPFIKVEATKFTEVGYVGRDVDSIIRDLVEIAVKNTREQEMRKVRPRAEDAAEERVLDALLPGVPAGRGQRRQLHAPALPQDAARGQARRQGDRDRRGAGRRPAWRSSPRPAWRSSRSRSRACSRTWAARGASAARCTIREALRLLTDEEAAKLVNEEEIRFKALRAVEQDGIVFIDEIDKIASRGEMQGADVSRQGVQRDLLPLVEGTAVTTKYGMIRTDHILFIASGAFHLAQALGPDPGAAGAPADPRGALEPVGRGLRAHPHRHRRLPHAPVPGAARHRGRGARVHARGRAPPGRDRATR